MVKLCVTIFEEDLSLYDTEAKRLGLNRSAYLRYLIKEHEKVLPKEIEEKQLIDKCAELITLQKSILLYKEMTEEERLLYFCQVESLKEMFLKEIASGTNEG